MDIEMESPSDDLETLVADADEDQMGDGWKTQPSSNDPTAC